MDAQAVLRGFDDPAVSVKAEYRIVHQDRPHAAQGRAQPDFNLPVIEPEIYPCAVHTCMAPGSRLAQA